VELIIIFNPKSCHVEVRQILIQNLTFKVHYRRKFKLFLHRCDKEAVKRN
jgi:hypothetical protein